MKWTEADRRIRGSREGWETRRSTARAKLGWSAASEREDSAARLGDGRGESVWWKHCERNSRVCGLFQSIAIVGDDDDDEIVVCD